MSHKISIYQVFTRLFGNQTKNPVFGGTIEENGSGKFSNFTLIALEAIKNLGMTHIWYTGVIEHATATGYEKDGIAASNPFIIKGRAGSPYAIRDYYDVNADLANDPEQRMKEFEQLIDRSHAAGLKVIIDFVPNHVARDYHSDQLVAGAADFGLGDNTEKAFDPQNNFYYIPGRAFQRPEGLNPFGKDVFAEDRPKFIEIPAKATGNDCFTANPSVNDWYETVKLNYGVDYHNGMQKHFDPVPDTWKKMLHILKYWAAKKIDGFRCDMAEMVPVEFWHWAIAQVKNDFPEVIFIAEIYQPDQYQNYIEKGGFDYLYDKVGLYDILRALIEGKANASQISDAWMNLQGQDEHMLRFLENHDEQRIASRFFAGNPFKALPAWLITVCIERGPVMTYFGQECGEKAEGASGFAGDDGRTTIFDYWHVPAHLKWYNGGKCDGAQLNPDETELLNHYRSILKFALSCPAVRSGHFYDLMYANYEKEEMNTYKAYAFLRFTAKEQYLFVCSFGLQETSAKVRIPKHAFGEMRLVAIGDYLFEDVFAPGNSISADAQDIFNIGLPVELGEWDYKVFKMKKKED